MSVPSNSASSESPELTGLNAVAWDSKTSQAHRIHHLNKGWVTVHLKKFSPFSRLDGSREDPLGMWTGMT